MLKKLKNVILHSAKIGYKAAFFSGTLFAFVSEIKNE